jgi:hypothetical protein
VRRRHPEGGLGHPERLEDLALEVHVERLSGEHFHEVTDDIGRHAIADRGARLEV